MNVTNDYEPPAYLTHRAKRRGRQLDLAAALAATAVQPRTDEVTVDDVLQMRGHVTIEWGVLTFSDGATLDLADLVRERNALLQASGAPARAIQAQLVMDIGAIEQFLFYSVQAGSLEGLDTTTKDWSMRHLLSVLPQDRFALGEVAGFAIEIERLQVAVSTHGPADHENDIFELITSLGGVPVATSSNARRDSERAGQGDARPSVAG